MLLSKCPRNSRGRLVSIDVDPAYRLRLQELGLRSGAEFFVANRAAFGGVVINIAAGVLAEQARAGARRCLRREGSVGLRAAREESREVDAAALGELASLRPAGESIRQVHGIWVLAERRQ